MPNSRKSKAEPHTPLTKSYTLERKYKALLEVEAKKKTVTQIAHSYGIPSSTLFTWIKKTAQIKEAYQNNKHTRNRKSLKFSKLQDIEQALLDWIKLMKEKDVKLSSKIVKRKTSQLAEYFGYKREEFKGSIGWVSRFRNRHGFTCSFDQKEEGPSG